MSPEKEEALCRDFPHLFGDRNAPLTQSLMGFGFENNDGWEPLIRRLANKLEPLIVKWIDEKIQQNDMQLLESWGFPRASQVKEKYGTLCFYMTHATDEMYDLINKAEAESAKTCEQCGKKGKLRGKSWYYTLCNSCWKKHCDERGYVDE
jgi:hypothetical protein